MQHLPQPAAVIVGVFHPLAGIVRGGDNAVAFIVGKAYLPPVGRTEAEKTAGAIALKLYLVAMSVAHTHERALLRIPRPIGFGKPVHAAVGKRQIPAVAAPANLRIVKSSCGAAVFIKGVAVAGALGNPGVINNAAISQHQIEIGIG
ncbi:MAG TPA: hypothetical protein VKB60_04030, partial [Terriglobales bacterium]|nr:hypothetical protein [Terriglobales bacterium]